jgi:hypothetical protein
MFMRAETVNLFLTREVSKVCAIIVQWMPKSAQSIFLTRSPAVALSSKRSIDGAYVADH